jgi:hypothetical protein
MAILDVAGLDRREFLQRGVLAGLGLALSPFAALADSGPAPLFPDMNSPRVRA